MHGDGASAEKSDDNAPNDAFKTAKNGGEHAGTLRNYEGRSTPEIQKAERSYLRQVELHQQKIQNPSKFAEDWNQLTPEGKNQLLEHWAKDARRNKQLADIMRGILQERGL